MRNPERLAKALPWFALALAAFAADQGSKAWANSALASGWREVTGFFNLVLLRNTGSAFSFPPDAGAWQQALFAAFAVAMCVVMAVIILKEPGNRLQAAAAALVMGGAAGNLADRVALGAVTDFIDLHVGGFHWPAFNIADSAICLGVFLFIVLELRKKD